jgi:hypothetical protein
MQLSGQCLNVVFCMVLQLPVLGWWHVSSWRGANACSSQGSNLCHLITGVNPKH